MTNATWRRLPRTSPEAAGVARDAIAQLVDRLEPLGTHSLLVMRHGAVVAEQFWAPHTPERPHMMFSVSKTFTAMAIGLAVADGLLTVEDRVVDLLPDALPAHVSDNLAAMRVEHLLTMTSGHAGDLMDAAKGADWPRAMLAAEVPLEPGSRFAYNTGATYLLSAIITRLTGQRLLDYLTPRVFAPLGIDGATWEQDPRGIDTGGYGLSITTEDMAAFGQLLLQRGRWGDVQLIPAEWIDTASADLVDSAPQGWGVDNSIGYGYQMWRCQPGCARADGAFGQFIVVWPQHDAVVAITSGSPKTQEQLDAVWECLGSAFSPSDPQAPQVPRAPQAPQVMPDDGADVGRPQVMPDAAADVGRPQAVPAADVGRPLALAMPQGKAWTAVGDRIEGRTFTLDAAASLLGTPKGTPPVRDITVRRDGDVVVLDAGPMHARAAHGRWGATHGEDFGFPSASTYAWTDDRTLEVRLAGLGLPFVWTVRLRFADDAASVEVAIDQNVAFHPTELVRATARSAVTTV